MNETMRVQNAQEIGKTYKYACAAASKILMGWSPVSFGVAPAAAAAGAGDATSCAAVEPVAISLPNSGRQKIEPSTTGIPSLSSMHGLDLMSGFNGAHSFRGTPNLTGMRDWLQQLGHSDTDLERLNVIHVAGTKGKGSTCAFIDSFLRVYGERTGFPQRVGLYTSPHLKCVQERIRINSRPLSEDLFAKYVFEVWDRLSEHATKKPRYGQLLMLVSVHAFIKEGVDVAIYETHLGGEYDATNVFQKPVATGITTLGMDHVEQLGPSVEMIAWHKAGIFKRGSPAFSTLQQPETTKVLQRRAIEKGVALKFVNINPTLPANTRALKPEVQRINSSLAIALASAFLKKKAPKHHCNLTWHDVHKGVEQFSWPGRFHQIVNGNHQWFLDGAHNELSVQKAAEWFAALVSEMQSNNSPLPRILIFSHLSERDGTALLKCIAKSLKQSGIEIQHVILTTYEERRDGTIRTDQCSQDPEKLFSPSLQEEYVEAWKSINPVVDILIEETIEGALNIAKRIGDQGNGMQTLVTGSLHLIGSALCLLETNTSAQESS